MDKETKIILNFYYDCDTHLLKFLVPDKFCDIISHYTHATIYLNTNRLKPFEIVDNRQIEGNYYKIEVDPIMSRLACSIHQTRNDLDFSGLDVRLLSDLNDFIDWRYLAENIEENEKTLKIKNVSRSIWEFSQFDAGNYLISSEEQLEFNKQFMDEITEYSEKNSCRIKYPKLQDLIAKGGVMAVSEWLFFEVVSLIVRDYAIYLLNYEDEN